jgi:outer membrane protein assembly factor BamB
MSKRNSEVSSRNSSQHTNLRLWPGIAIVIIQWVVRFVLPAIEPETLAIAVFGGLGGGLLIMIWWAFFSRAPIFERWSAIVLMIVVLFVTPLLTHDSISTGMMGLLYFVYVMPILSLAFVIWALVSQKMPEKLRRITMSLTIIVSGMVFTIFRSEGITGDAGAEFTWRWTDTHEEQLLLKDDDEIFVESEILEVTELNAYWPGFRGPNRDSKIHDLQIETDWLKSPPVEIWRRPIGPGISSFAVEGNYIYTQEQRGEDEVVSCYSLNSGKSVWKHRDPVRFWDSHAGAGPRGTPTLHGGRVYAIGPTGILNVLESQTGKVVWARNSAKDTGVEIPEWGISSSPLVVDSVVIVAAVGRLAAYAIDSGELLWMNPDSNQSYSSPHLVMIDSVKQVVFLNGKGVISVTPTDGKLLWDHEWPPGVRIVQPALISEGEFLIGGGDMNGIRRIAVTHSSDEWAVTEQWTSKRLKPYFNDFVIHKDYVYGFHGNRIVCIDIEKGNRQWRGDKYGYGQLILLADQDLLLLISEQGELALAQISPAEFKEIARIKALEGKTWNHPVLVEDILLLRNSQEMVAYRLTLLDG